MKILQLIQKLQTRGAEIFACQLSNHLVTLGHEVKVVAIFKGKGVLPFEGEIKCLYANTKTRFIAYKTWSKLNEIIKEFKPDIVQANAGDTLKYLVFSKLIFRWKTPIVARNASEVGRYLNSAIQKKYNIFLYRQVSQVISVSRASEKDILINFSFLSGKTSVIPVGVEPKTAIENLVLEPTIKKHILHVGGFSFEKNHSGLLRIFQSLLIENPMVQLHLVGDGALYKEVKKLVKELKLEKSITFYGFVNNPLAYIKAADILILPSVIEGLPGVLLEAMYCKTPVIAYDVGGISEIVNGDTGTLVDKGDENGFFSNIIKVLNNLDNSQINRAYKRVLKDFVNDNIAVKFVASYNKINT